MFIATAFAGMSQVPESIIAEHLKGPAMSGEVTTILSQTVCALYYR